MPKWWEFLEKRLRQSALLRSADPREQVFDGGFQAMISDVRPAVHEKIRVGLHFREFDPRVGLECVPRVAAAIAHELHFGLVFLVDRNKFAPIVLQAELLDQQVVLKRAVVRQFRPLCDPIPPRRRAPCRGSASSIFSRRVCRIRCRRNRRRPPNRRLWQSCPCRSCRRRRHRPAPGRNASYRSKRARKALIPSPIFGLRRGIGPPKTGRF